MTTEVVTSTPEYVKLSEASIDYAMVALKKLGHELYSEIDLRNLTANLSAQGEHLLRTHIEKARRQASSMTSRRLSWVESLSDGHYVKLEPGRREGGETVYTVTAGDMNPQREGDVIDLTEAAFFLQSFNPVNAPDSADNIKRINELAVEFAGYDNGVGKPRTIVLQPPVPFH